MRQYRLCGLEVTRLEEELQRWRSQAERVTAGTVLGGGGSSEDKLQRAVESMAALNEQLLEQLTHRVALRRDIEAAIGSIEEERLRQLMRYRYLEGWTWERIAVGMNYSYRQVTNLHGRALQEIKDCLVFPT